MEGSNIKFTYKGKHYEGKIVPALETLVIETEDGDLKVFKTDDITLEKLGNDEADYNLMEDRYKEKGTKEFFEVIIQNLYQKRRGFLKKRDINKHFSMSLNYLNFLLSQDTSNLILDHLTGITLESMGLGIVRKIISEKIKDKAEELEGQDISQEERKDLNSNKEIYRRVVITEDMELLEKLTTKEELAKTNLDSLIYLCSIIINPIKKFSEDIKEKFNPIVGRVFDYINEHYKDIELSQNLSLLKLEITQLNERIRKSQDSESIYLMSLNLLKYLKEIESLTPDISRESIRNSLRKNLRRISKDLDSDTGYDIVDFVPPIVQINIEKKQLFTKALQEENKELTNEIFSKIESEQLPASCFIYYGNTFHTFYGILSPEFREYVMTRILNLIDFIRKTYKDFTEKEKKDFLDFAFEIIVLNTKNQNGRQQILQSCRQLKDVMEEMKKLSSEDLPEWKIQALKKQLRRINMDLKYDSELEFMDVNEKQNLGKDFDVEKYIIDLKQRFDGNQKISLHPVVKTAYFHRNSPEIVERLNEFVRSEIELFYLPFGITLKEVISMLDSIPLMTDIQDVIGSEKARREKLWFDAKLSEWESDFKSNPSPYLFYVHVLKLKFNLDYPERIIKIGELLDKELDELKELPNDKNLSIIFSLLTSIQSLSELRKKLNDRVKALNFLSLDTKLTTFFKNLSSTEDSLSLLISILKDKNLLLSPISKDNSQQIIRFFQTVLLKNINNSNNESNKLARSIFDGLTLNGLFRELIEIIESVEKEIPVDSPDYIIFQKEKEKGLFLLQLLAKHDDSVTSNIDRYTYFLISRNYGYFQNFPNYFSFNRTLEKATKMLDNETLSLLFKDLIFYQWSNLRHTPIPYTEVKFIFSNLSKIPYAREILEEIQSRRNIQLGQRLEEFFENQTNLENDDIAEGTIGILNIYAYESSINEKTSLKLKKVLAYITEEHNKGSLKWTDDLLLEIHKKLWKIGLSDELIEISTKTIIFDGNKASEFIFLRILSIIDSGHKHGEKPDSIYFRAQKEFIKTDSQSIKNSSIGKKAQKLLENLKKMIEDEERKDLDSELTEALLNVMMSYISREDSNLQTLEDFLKMREITLNHLQRAAGDGRILLEILDKGGEDAVEILERTWSLRPNGTTNLLRIIEPLLDLNTEVPSDPYAFYLAARLTVDTERRMRYASIARKALSGNSLIPIENFIKGIRLNSEAVSSPLTASSSLQNKFYMAVAHILQKNDSPLSMWTAILLENFLAQDSQLDDGLLTPNYINTWIEYNQTVSTQEEALRKACMLVFRYNYSWDERDLEEIKKSLYYYFEEIKNNQNLDIEIRMNAGAELQKLSNRRRPLIHHFFNLYEENWKDPNALIPRDKLLRMALWLIRASRLGGFSPRKFKLLYNAELNEMINVAMRPVWKDAMFTYRRKKVLEDSEEIRDFEISDFQKVAAHIKEEYLGMALPENERKRITEILDDIKSLNFTEENSSKGFSLIEFVATLDEIQSRLVEKPILTGGEPLIIYISRLRFLVLKKLEGIKFKAPKPKIELPEWLNDGSFRIRIYSPEGDTFAAQIENVVIKVLDEEYNFELNKTLKPGEEINFEGRINWEDLIRELTILMYYRVEEQGGKIRNSRLDIDLESFDGFRQVVFIKQGMTLAELRKIHYPFITAKFLTDVNKDDGLKFITHDWNPSVSVPTFKDQIKHMRVGFDKCLKQIFNKTSKNKRYERGIPDSLYFQIRGFLGNEGIKQKTWQDPFGKFHDKGYNSDDWNEWLDLNPLINPWSVETGELGDFCFPLRPVVKAFKDSMRFYPDRNTSTTNYFALSPKGKTTEDEFEDDLYDDEDDEYLEDEPGGITASILQFVKYYTTELNDKVEMSDFEFRGEYDSEGERCDNIDMFMNVTMFNKALNRVFNQYFNKIRKGDDKSKVKIKIVRQPVKDKILPVEVRIVCPGSSVKEFGEENKYRIEKHNQGDLFGNARDGVGYWDYAVEYVEYEQGEEKFKRYNILDHNNRDGAGEIIDIEENPGGFTHVFTFFKYL